MARPQKAVIPPPWFDVRRYDAAFKVDAADWYLNLQLRRFATKDGASHHLSTIARDIVRSDAPVLSRHDIDEELHEWLWLHDTPPDFDALLDNQEPPSGIRPITVDGFYLWEHKLPAHIRELGHRPRRQVKPREVPPEFSQPVDYLIEPRMLNRCVWIDLSRPKDELAADLLDFIARERGADAQVPGRHPYAEALRLLGSRYGPKLDRFADIRLLAFMDIEQWRIELGMPDIPRAAMARLLGIDARSVSQAGEYAALLLDDFILRGWLIGPARDAIRNQRK